MLLIAGLMCDFGDVLGFHIAFGSDGAGATFRAYHASGDGFVGDGIDEDEASGLAVVGVVVEIQFLRRRNLNSRDVIEMELGGFFAMKGVDINLVGDAFDVGANGSAGVFYEQSFRAGEIEGVFGHPADHDVEFTCHFWKVAFADEHVAAADIDFVFECDDDGLAGECFLEVSVNGDDFFDARCAFGWERHDFFTGADSTRCDASGKAAEF